MQFVRLNIPEDEVDEDEGLWRVILSRTWCANTLVSWTICPQRARYRSFLVMVEAVCCAEERRRMYVQEEESAGGR